MPQGPLIVGEIVEVTGRSGKGKTWENGTAKLLAIHQEVMASEGSGEGGEGRKSGEGEGDASSASSSGSSEKKNLLFDVKYVLGGKGMKIPQVYVRRFGTPAVEIPIELIDAEKKAAAVPIEFTHGVVLRATGKMKILNDDEEEGREVKEVGLPPTKKQKKHKGMDNEHGKDKEEKVEFVVRCWTGTTDPNPRPDVYFGRQRNSLIPLSQVDESEKALKFQQQEINDSAAQKPATAHCWRHADRPIESIGVDTQVRIDNTLSKMYLPLDINIDQSGPKSSPLPKILLEVDSSSVVDGDTESTQLCDEVCAELQYLQWKLNRTMQRNVRKTKMLENQYLFIHEEERLNLEELQEQRDSIESLREKVIAAQKDKEKKKIQREIEERAKIIKVRSCLTSLLLLFL